MNQNLLSRVLEFLRRKMWNKRWQRVATCLSAVAVFGVTYALILPAVTATRSYPTLSAEELSAWSGDELTAFVNAENTEDSGEKVIVLTAEGEGADLSDLYEFNNEGVCVVTDKSGAEIELHRVVRAEDTNKNRVFYWFRLEAGQETSLALDLADRQDASRFAQTVEAVKEAAKENKEAEAENMASASDAPKAAAAAAGAKKSTASATASNAGSRGTASNAVSGDDIAQANAYAKSEEEKIQTETDDDGFVQISDGAVVDDRPDSEKAEDQEVAETEIVASLKLSAGSGETFDDAVKDADKNADKRGDAQLTFTWKDVTLQDAEIAHPDLSTELDDGTTFTVFYDRTAGIPEDAVLTVTEIEKGGAGYEEYFAKTGAAVAALEENAGLGLRDARIYDVRIENADEDLVDILTPVRLMVTYADTMSIDEESSINLVSFNTYEPRAYSPGAVEGGDEIAALSFTADASAVYAVAEVGTLEAKVLTADGTGYNVTVSYGIDAHIPKGATLEVSEIPADSPEYEEYRSIAENAAVRAAGEEVGTARLFDIAIMYEGREVQPDVPVDVRIDFDDSIEKAEEEEFRMVHLGEGSTDVLDVSLQGDLKESGMYVDGVMFSTDGFSKFMLTGLLMKAPALTVSGESGVIKNFKTEVFYGGEEKDVEKIWDPTANSGTGDYVDYDESKYGNGYVWTAPSSAEGHRFNFRISFGLSVETSAEDVVFPAETVKVRVPKSILNDRNGDQADRFEMSIPSRDDVAEAEASGEILDQDMSFAWYEDGDDIVIYNFRAVDNGFDGFIEMSYLTDKATFDYRDMSISDPYVATITAKDPTAAPEAEPETDTTEDDPLYVIIDTQVDLLSTVERIPDKFDTWQSSWGPQPEVPEGKKYTYFVWEVRSVINENSEMYNFQIRDFLNNLKATKGGEAADPDALAKATEFLGVIFSGDGGKFTPAVKDTATGIKTATQTDPKLPGYPEQKKEQTAEGFRYDYVITAFDTDVWGKYDHWEMTNNTTVIVDPYDQLDPDIEKTTTRPFTWNIPIFDPSGGGAGYGGMWIRADGWYRYATQPENMGRVPTVYYGDLGMVAGDYTRYDLYDLVGEPRSTKVDYLDNLDYAVHSSVRPMPWTKASKSNADPDKPWEDFFVEPVKYELVNDRFFVHDEHVPLTEKKELNEKDYQIDSVAFSVRVVDHAYNPNTAAFDRNVPVTYMPGEEATVYGKKPDGTWVEVARYDMAGKEFTKTVPSYVASSWVQGNNAQLSFTESSEFIGYKIKTSNKHYQTTIASVPNVRIKYVEGNNIDTTVQLGIEQPTDSIGVQDYATLTVTDWKGTEHHFAPEFNDNSGVDYVRNVEKEPNLNKKPTYSSNDPKRRRYTITWKIHLDETMRITVGGIGEEKYIAQNGGTFYDLLPLGAILNPNSAQVFAGERELSASEYTISEVSPNYNNSGRALVKVEINASGDYFDLFYDTVHPYEALKDYGNIVVNPIVYKTGNATISQGSSNSQADLIKKDTQDLFFLSDENAQLMANVGGEDPDSTRYIPTEQEFDIAAITASATGLSKKVKSESSTNYGSEAMVENNAYYSYRLRYQNTNSSTSRNVILYDSLENFEPSTRTRDWHGELQSIDFSALPKDAVTRNPLVAPVVYISTQELEIKDKERDAANRNLNDNSIWTKVEDPTDTDALKNARAIAFDLSKTPDGELYEVPKLGSLTVILTMKSPDGADKTDKREGKAGVDGAKLEDGYPETYNTVYVDRTVETDTQTREHEFAEAGSYVTTRLRVSKNVHILKLGEDDSLPIPRISFQLRGTSDYGTAVNRIETTDSNGRLTFKGVEKGEYELTEYETTPDWLRNTDIFTVRVTADGKVFIKDKNGIEKETTDVAYKITNKPRIHGDLEFLKRRTITDTDTSVVPIPDVTFKLEGMSGYGNDVYKLATSSDPDGRVYFGDIEWGSSYTLKEIQTSDDYALNPNEYTVKVDENGNASIWLGNTLVQDKDGIYPLIFNNKRYWDFALRKVDADNPTRTLEGAKFELSGGGVTVATTSNANGMVFFTHLKPGRYLLKETEAPRKVDGSGHVSENGYLNYEVDNNTYVVDITEEGKVTIEGLEKSQGSYEFTVKDPRSMDGKIYLYKYWVDDVTDPTKRPFPKVIMKVDDSEPITYRGITVVKEWIGDIRDARDQDKTVITLLKTSAKTPEGQTLVDYVKGDGGTIPITNVELAEDKTYTVTATYENEAGTPATYPEPAPGGLTIFQNGEDNLKGTLYSFRLKENDNLILDLVPAVENSTYGMYDLISRTFYPANGYVTGADALEDLVVVADSTNTTEASWDRSTDVDGYWTLRFPNIVVDGKYTYYVYESKIPEGYKSTSGDKAHKMAVVGGNAVIANQFTNNIWNFPFKPKSGTSVNPGVEGIVQEWTAPGTGKYKLQVWGAKGGNDGSGGNIKGGSGGYSEEIIQLPKGRKLYIFVGGEGVSCTSAAKGGWNGGGRAGTSGSSGGGGGMTHISTTNNPVDNNGKDTNASRIGAWDPSGTLIVAGGGGGAGYPSYPGGFGGGINGGVGDGNKKPASTQTSGFTQGYGQLEISTEGKDVDGGGGGAGWWGGSASQVGDYGGNGGSGYVSTAANVTNAVTKGGDEEFLSPAGNMETGHADNGYARITMITEDSGDTPDIPDPTQVDPVLPSYTYMTEDGFEDGKWKVENDNTWSYVFDVFNPNAKFTFEELKSFIENGEKKNNLEGEGYVADAWVKTIDGSITQSVFFTNRKASEYGKLKITKELVGLPGSTQSFGMTLTLTGPKINTSGTQIIGNDVFDCEPLEGSTEGSTSGGKAVRHFDLEAGSTYELINIPVGTEFSLVEDHNENFEVSYKVDGAAAEEPATGTIKNEEETDTTLVTVTNTYNKPKETVMPVVLKKVVTGKSQNDTIEDKFNFVVAFTNLTKNLQYRYTVSSASNAERTEYFMSGENQSPVVRLSLMDGETATFEGIPEGATYRITEFGGDWLPSYSIEDLAENTKGHSILQSTGENTSKGMDLSTAQEVAEAGENDDEGEVEQIVVTFTNKIENYQKVTIKKKVKLEEGYESYADPSEVFQMTVTFSNLTEGTRINSTKGPLVVPEDSNEVSRVFELKDNEEVTFSNIPVGAKYSFSEANNGYVASYEYTDEPDIIAPESYKPTFVKQTGSNALTNRTLATALETVDRYENAVLTYTNEQKLAPVIIRKNVVSNVDGDKDKVFSFALSAQAMRNITTPGGSISESGEITKDGIVEFTEGIWNFTLKHGDYKVVWLPIGLRFTLTETSDPDDHFLATYKVGTTGTETTGNMATVVVYETTSQNQNRNRIDFTNTRYNIGFRKTDLKGNELNGAKFQLNRQVTGGRWENYLGSNKYLTFGKKDQILMPGKYQLVEKAAPTGFIVGGNIIFTVTKDGNVILDENNPKDRAATASNADGSTSVEITVKNEPGSALPKTGGPGTILYTVSGLMLLAASAFMFRSRMNRSR